jgi:hypothetical protein
MPVTDDDRLQIEPQPVIDRHLGTLSLEEREWLRRLFGEARSFLNISSDRELLSVAHRHRSSMSEGSADPPVAVALVAKEVLRAAACNF